MQPFLGREESLNVVLFFHWLGFNRLPDELFYLVSHIDVSAQVDASELSGEDYLGYNLSDDRLTQVCEVEVETVQVLVHLKHLNESFLELAIVLGQWNKLATLFDLFFA